MFLTLFIMGPVFEQAYQDGVVPLINQDIDEFEAFERGMKPFRGFMLQHVREKDLVTFMDMAKLELPEDAADAPLQVR
jgi:flagellar biosynthetic protein FliP